MDADECYGIGMRWLAPAPGPSSFAGEPALSLSKRGDQSRARGRSNAVTSHVGSDMHRLDGETGSAPCPPL